MAAAHDDVTALFDTLKDTAVAVLRLQQHSPCGGPLQPETPPTPTHGHPHLHDDEDDAAAFHSGHHTHSAHASSLFLLPPPEKPTAPQEGTAAGMLTLINHDVQEALIDDAKPEAERVSELLGLTNKTSAPTTSLPVVETPVVATAARDLLAACEDKLVDVRKAPAHCPVAVMDHSSAHDNTATAAQLGDAVEAALHSLFSLDSSVTGSGAGTPPTPPTHPSLFSTSTRERKAAAAALPDRKRMRFSPDKIDAITCHAVSLLEHLEHDLVKHTGRLRDWFGWHFPPLSPNVRAAWAEYSRAVSSSAPVLSPGSLPWSALSIDDDPPPTPPSAAVRHFRATLCASRHIDGVESHARFTSDLLFSMVVLLLEADCATAVPHARALQHRDGMRLYGVHIVGRLLRLFEHAPLPITSDERPATRGVRYERGRSGSGRRGTDSPPPPGAAPVLMTPDDHFRSLTVPASLHGDTPSAQFSRHLFEFFAGTIVTDIVFDRDPGVHPFWRGFIPDLFHDATVVAGVKLAPADTVKLQSMAEVTRHALMQRCELHFFLASRVAALTPKLTRLLGPEAAARLIARSGGVQALATAPAQVISSATVSPASGPRSFASTPHRLPPSPHHLPRAGPPLVERPLEHNRRGACRGHPPPPPPPPPPPAKAIVQLERQACESHTAPVVQVVSEAPEVPASKKRAVEDPVATQPSAAMEDEASVLPSPQKKDAVKPAEKETPNAEVRPADSEKQHGRFGNARGGARPLERAAATVAPETTVGRVEPPPPPQSHSPPQPQTQPPKSEAQPPGTAVQSEPQAASNPVPPSVPPPAPPALRSIGSDQRPSRATAPRIDPRTVGPRWRDGPANDTAPQQAQHRPPPSGSPHHHQQQQQQQQQPQQQPYYNQQQHPHHHYQHQQSHPGQQFQRPPPAAQFHHQQAAEIQQRQPPPAYANVSGARPPPPPPLAHPSALQPPQHVVPATRAADRPASPRRGSDERRSRSPRRRRHSREREKDRRDRRDRDEKHSSRRREHRDRDRDRDREVRSKEKERDRRRRDRDKDRRRRRDRSSSSDYSSDDSRRRRRRERRRRRDDSSDDESPRRSARPDTKDKKEKEKERVKEHVRQWDKETAMGKRSREPEPAPGAGQWSHLPTPITVGVGHRRPSPQSVAHPR